MQTIPTAATWIAQANLATAAKVEELVNAGLPSFEAHEELRGHFDQLYIDLYHFEADERIRAEVIPAIQKLDNEMCNHTFH